MSAVVGIDLSSRAIDLVKLAEDSNHATWTRCEPPGEKAWERTLEIPRVFADGLAVVDFWDDVYLTVIEAPYGRGQAGTNAILNRVVGAISASLPAHLRRPERCWIVGPHEWKAGLGLKAKPSWADLERLAGGAYVDMPRTRWVDAQEHFRDAYAMALWARDVNAKAVAAA